MWKIGLGFIVFAGVAVWMLSKGGDIDMGGEKHEINVPHATTPASAPAAPSAVPAVNPAPSSEPAASGATGKL